MSAGAKYVVDIMTPNPVVGPDLLAWRAEELGREREVHDLLVIDGYRLVGVVCLCDLEEVMTCSRVDSLMWPPVTIDDQQLAENARVLSGRDVRVCVSCGSTHGLGCRKDDELAPCCRRCLRHAAPPRTVSDDAYFTLGGGD